MYVRVLRTTLLVANFYLYSPSLLLVMIIFESLVRPLQVVRLLGLFMLAFKCNKILSKKIKKLILIADQGDKTLITGED